MTRTPSACFVVAIDGSPQAERALQVATDLARRFGASLVLLHVAVARPLSSFDAPHAAVRADAAAQRYGEHLLERATRLAGDVAITGELHFGDPADAICRRAEELAARMVVVGSRGLGRLDRFLLGSVSSAVVQRAPCSVLVVRATGTAAQGAQAFLTESAR